jgi:cytoskeletal protein RodZ
MTSRSVGEILKSKREAKKITLADLSGVTKIHKKHLQALEENRWSELPELAFVKGYLISYAQALEFDARPVLAILRRDYPFPKQKQSGWLNKIQPKKSFPVKIGWFALGLLIVVGTISAYILFQWYVANQPPSLIVYTPDNQAEVDRTVVVEGVTSPDVTVRVNDQAVALDQDGNFATKVNFPVSGLAAVIISAEDQRGHTSEIVRYVRVRGE